MIRNKILRFYFVGEFDVSPFMKMPLSALPKVISQIEGNAKQSAMYRLLKNIPELCNDSGRELSDQPGNKRLKTNSSN